MRRLSLAIAAALTFWGVANAQPLPPRRAPQGATPVSAPADLSVAAGQASYVTLGGAVRDIVVGDPTIADVSVVNDRTLVVLGKRPGVTSLLAFGPSGRALTDRQIVVTESGAGGVTIYRGASASTYACGTQCTRLTPADAPAGGPTSTP